MQLIPVLLVAVIPKMVAAATPERHWALDLGGGIALATPAFSGSSRFVEFAEAGTISTRRTPRSGGAVEAGLWHAVSRHVGVAVLASSARRDAPGTFSASFPHPLYLDRPRAAAGTLPAGRLRETAIHVALVWSAAWGGVTARVSAGPSYVLAEADLVDEILHTDAYPYDTVQVTGARTTPVRGDAVGGHAGVAFERRIGARLAVSAGARFTRATIALQAGHDDTARTAETKAGGLTATASLRLYF